MSSGVRLYGVACLLVLDAWSVCLLCWVIVDLCVRVAGEYMDGVDDDGCVCNFKSADLYDVVVGVAGVLIWLSVSLWKCAVICVWVSVLFASLGVLCVSWLMMVAVLLRQWVWDSG